MIVNKKTLKWWALGFLIALLIVAMITIDITTPKKYNLPNDVVELSDGSIISLSHYYDVGYWKGVNEMLVYLQNQNLLRKDTTITIHLDTLIERNNILGKEYFNKNNLKSK